MVVSGWYWQALSVATALACGLLIGIERGWKLKDQKPGTRVAGVRTFTMLGLGNSRQRYATLQYALRNRFGSLLSES